MKINFHNSRAWLAMLVPVLFGFGPCGPIAGGQLSGTVVNDVVKDFRFVNDVDQCALEVNPAKPHSVTVNCWTVGKQLFVGCMDCAEKEWSAMIEQNPAARIRIDDKIYPVKASRMQDQIAIKRAWGYRWDKYEEGEPAPLPDGYWLYHLGSKPGNA